MLRIVKARYRNGVIELLEEIDLADGTEISITIDTRRPMSQEEKEKRFLSSAGRWKDIVDEAFLDEIYEQRRRSCESDFYGGNGLDSADRGIQ